MITLQVPDYNLEYVMMFTIKNCIESHPDLKMPAIADLLGIAHSALYRRMKLLRTPKWEAALGKLEYRKVGRRMGGRVYTAEDRRHAMADDEVELIEDIKYKKRNSENEIYMETISEKRAVNSIRSLNKYGF